MPPMPGCSLDALEMLEDLIADWKERRKLGSLTDLIEQNVARKLREPKFGIIILWKPQEPDWVGSGWQRQRFCAGKNLSCAR